MLYFYAVAAFSVQMSQLSVRKKGECSVEFFFFSNKIKIKTNVLLQVNAYLFWNEICQHHWSVCKDKIRLHSTSAWNWKNFLLFVYHCIVKLICTHSFFLLLIQFSSNILWICCFMNIGEDFRMIQLYKVQWQSKAKELPNRIGQQNIQSIQLKVLHYKEQKVE